MRNWDHMHPNNDQIGQLSSWSHSIEDSHVGRKHSSNYLDWLVGSYYQIEKFEQTQKISNIIFSNFMLDLKSKNFLNSRFFLLEICAFGLCIRGRHSFAINPSLFSTMLLSRVGSPWAWTWLSHIDAQTSKCRYIIGILSVFSDRNFIQMRWYKVKKGILLLSVLKKQ